MYEWTRDKYSNVRPFLKQAIVFSPESGKVVPISLPFTSVTFPSHTLLNPLPLLNKYNYLCNSKYLHYGIQKHKPSKKRSFVQRHSVISFPPCSAVNLNVRIKLIRSSYCSTQTTWLPEITLTSRYS